MSPHVIGRTVIKLDTKQRQNLQNHRNSKKEKKLIQAHVAPAQRLHSLIGYVQLFQVGHVCLIFGWNF